MALNRRNRSHILATASLLVITAACIIAAGCTAGTSAPGAVSGLNGVTWSLDSYLDENDTLIPVLSGTEVSARFDDDGKVGGSAGCNYYGGNYSLDGTDLSVSSLVQTLKLCTEPEGIMDQEARFMELLGSAAGCRIEDERLILTDADGTDVLVFTKEEPAELAGTSWELATLSDENGAMIPVLAGTNVTLVFGADGGLGGSAGCNSYGADCTVDGANLTIEPPIRTEMYCSEPPGLMDQEDRYLAHLTNTSSYRTEGGRLIFTDHEGADLLVFEPVAPTPDLPFTGTDWVLEAYSTGGDAVSSVLAGTTITAEFSPDGNVTGNAGCNSYGAGYVLDGANLTIEPPISTKMYCNEPEGVMEQENTYLNLLSSVSSYRVEGNRLSLANEAGTDLLTFVQAPSSEGRWMSPPDGGDYDLLDEDGNVVASY